MKLPVGTVGYLVDSQLGSMVQWQHVSNGWRVFLAEIKVVDFANALSFVSEKTLFTICMVGL